MWVYRWNANEMGQRRGESCRHLLVQYAKLIFPPRDNLQHLYTAPTEVMGSENFSFHLISLVTAPAFKCSGSIHIKGAVMKVDLLCVRRMDMVRVGAEHSKDWYHTRRVICHLASAFILVCIGVIGWYFHRWERVCRSESCYMQSVALTPQFP